MQTYLKSSNLWNACQIYFVECVSKIKHILSVIHYTICGAVCFQLPISLVMIERTYILCLIIIIKSEVWTITHCLGLGHETMVSAVCLSIFLSIMRKLTLDKINNLTNWGSRTPYGDINPVSTLVQVMTCYLTATSHYHNQCWQGCSLAFHMRAVSSEMLVNLFATYVEILYYYYYYIYHWPMRLVSAYPHSGVY